MKIAGAKEKLQKTILAVGAKQVEATLEGITKEYNLRQDRIVRPSVLDYIVGTNGIQLVIKEKKKKAETLNLTNHATQHLYYRTGVPGQYAAKLMEFGETELLRTNLLQMGTRTMENGVLIRSVGGVVKGFLSPSFKRMDASPVMGAFVESALKAGYNPYEGYNTDYRYELRFIYPELMEPSKDEFVVYGLSLRTGDYGGVPSTMELFALRVSCTNLAVGYDIFRKVHIGKRFDLGENESMILSEKTHRLDSDTMASAVADVTAKSLDYIQVVDDSVKAAVANKLDDENAIQIIDQMRKRGVTKDVAEKVKLLWETDMPVESLPKEKNLWRLSNAISLIANSENFVADKKIDLQAEAMTVLRSN